MTNTIRRAYFATGEIIEVCGGKTYFKRKVREVLRFIDDPAHRVWFRKTPELKEAVNSYLASWRG